MELGMKVIKADEAQRICVENLRLDGEACHNESPEVVAANIRRAASFSCPCPGSKLIQAVHQIQKFLVADADSFKEKISEALESVIAYGDLIEEADAITSAEQKRGRILYLRPPSFVWRGGGSALLLGVAPDDVSVLPVQLEKRVEFFNHIRRIQQLDGEDLKSDLKSFGLRELPVDVWNRRKAIPATETPQAHIQSVKNRLKENPGELNGVQILSPQKAGVSFYKRRWENVGNQTGFFMARRPQLYGNDLWCGILLQNGRPLKLADFPMLDKHSLGRDEAWRLQMAIDAELGSPQIFTIETLSSSNAIIKFYSPIPTWAQRRLDNLGEPVGAAGCLFSYKLLNTDLEQEIEFLKEKLWLVQGN